MIHEVVDDRLGNEPERVIAVTGAGLGSPWAVLGEVDGERGGDVAPVLLESLIAAAVGDEPVEQTYLATLGVVQMPALPDPPDDCVHVRSAKRVAGSTASRQDLVDQDHHVEQVPNVLPTSRR